MLRSRSRNLTDYRAVLNTRGEVVIGAYARAQRRRRMLVGFAGVALIVTAGTLYFLLRPATLEAGTRVPVLVQCMESGCGHKFVAQVDPKQARYPLVCMRCGAAACQKVWECRDCGHQWVPPGRPSEIVCPRCHGRRVGTAEQPQP